MKYAALRQAVQEAGFHAPHIRVMADRDMLVCTEKYLKRFGFSGVIAFVSEVDGEWFLATPYPHYFRIRNPSKVAEAIVSFLGRNRKKKGDYGPSYWEGALLKIEYAEFEHAGGKPGG